MAYREAVVVIHGMGEQRPLDTLDNLADAMRSEAARNDEVAPLISRPTSIGGSYEARRYIIRPRFPSAEERGVSGDGRGFQARPHRELFEYHWSPKMSGNRLADLLTTTRRILWSLPRDVPAGIRGLWTLMWAVILLAVAVAVAGATAVAVGFDTDQLRNWLDAQPLWAWLTAIPGFAIVVAVLSPVLGYLLTRVLPQALTVSFVDVVRYLDTSTRSYDVRRDIRAGAVEMLRQVNEEYDRVTVVAHSLGSYIAYDALRHLWGEIGDVYTKDASQRATRRVERTLAALADASTEPTADDIPWTPFEDSQRDLYEALRKDGLDWRITDLITFGSPMYMANRIYTKDDSQFQQRVERLEFPTCPPQPDNPQWSRGAGPDDELPAADPEEAAIAAKADEWSWIRDDDGRRVLHQAALFAPVRWTNFWFPTSGMSGDWFGDALEPLFGHGIVDVPIDCGGDYRRGWGMPHARYLPAIANHPDDKVAKVFHDALFARRPRRSVACTDPADITTAAAESEAPRE